VVLYPFGPETNEEILPENVAHKTHGAALLPARREASRRFPVKVMYLAVVTCPNNEHNFSGKIFFKRVARDKVLARGFVNKHFVDSVGENE
jgi:hypothetical protein